MSHRVWVLGDAVVDLVPDDAGRYLKCPGGAPANVAVGIARLAGHSAFIGRVGDDPFGRFMQQTLQREQVEIGALQRDAAHNTSTVVVDLDEHGERSFNFLVRPSADLFLQVSDLPTFAPGEWLHLCSIALSREPSRSTALQAMTAIHAAGGYVSFDPNLRPAVWENPHDQRHWVDTALAYADVVKLSTEELAWLTDTDDLEVGIEQLQRRYGFKLLLVTLGGEGVMLATPAEPLRHLPTRKVQPVDTTGAGDAFVAGLLAGLAENAHWPSPPILLEIVQQAQACGALATTARGAMTALPNRQQLEAFFAAPNS